MRKIFHNLAPAAGITLVLCAAILALPPKANAQEEAAPAEVQTLDLPFVTLRNRTGSKDPEERFGGERSDLKAGHCEAGAIDLGALSPLAEAAPTFLREELLAVREVREKDPATVLDELLETAAPHGPALYVHGYYIGFGKGCRRAALLQENAGLEGRFLWFSWPSDGAAAYYIHDEADLYWSVPDLADMIIELERRFGAVKVDVIGHSLGARGVVLALYEVANRHPDIRLGQIVLLAPDMDFEIFARILHRIAPIADGMTIYATTGDKPLALSRQLHGYPRLGESGNDVSRLEGVEVIDLSELPGESPTGHLYHIYDPRVGTDLQELLNARKRADARPGLVRKGSNLWFMQPAEEN